MFEILRVGCLLLSCSSTLLIGLDLGLGFARLGGSYARCWELGCCVGEGVMSPRRVGG